MKLRTTTPASISFVTRVTLVLASVLILCAVPLQLSQKVFADRYDDQINALQQDIDSYNAQAAVLNAQAQTLQSTIAGLQNQAAATQAKIDLSQAQYDKLVAQIADTEQKIKDNQDALGKTLADMYVDDKITPIEMLASSKNVSDYLDKQEYRSSVRDQLTNTIGEIKDLRTKLTKQQAEVKVVLDRQKAEKASLVNTQNQQQELLVQTQGQEAAYQQLISSNRQKMSDSYAQQRAYYQNLIKGGGSGDSGVSGAFQYSNWSGNQGCGGAYPDSKLGGWGHYGCSYGLDDGIDEWQLYNRECVSYVAWAIEYRFGKHVDGFYGAGMPDQWVYNSSATRVYDPQPGDAVVLPPTSDGFAPVGHLMVVESVSGDNIHVSQFNFYGTGEYSTMDIKNSGIQLLRFQ